MKTVYFVRHGEGEKNISDSWIGDVTGLTKNGKKQAKFIASRCNKLLIDVIVSSTLQRAKDTSEIIKNKINKPIYYSDLFIERKWPSEQSGLVKKAKNLKR